MHRMTLDGPVALSPEEVAEYEQRQAQAAIDAARNAILAQIVALEGTVTQRRMREALLTEAGAAWLANVDGQIAALRAQLA
ncbi:MAG TPA: hypothetical protein VEC35_23425 [Noviherbaspirillum sp.]|nr:hypothetical protein [Noviherbaspirillum sp.]